MPDGPGTRIWYAVYNVVLHVGLCLYLPVWLVKRLRGRYRGQFRERFGRLPASLAARFGERPGIWVHAASAGETASAAPLVRLLREAYPGHAILFTVTSQYGKEMAIRQLGGVVDGICFSPFDLPSICRRVLRRVRPVLYLMVETDLWPNMVREARAQGAAVVIASGHAGSGTLPRPFWRAVFRQIDLLLMQTDVDARNIVRRGAAPECVEVGGNLKFDATGGVLPETEHAALRKDLGLPDGAPVFVAGSTLAEDEGPVLDSIATLRGEGLDLHVVLAPRRQERVAEVVKGCAARGLPCARRTEGGHAPILVLDTMGELARTYNVCDVAYVGGGLTPDVGLHNLLEPLVCGAPVLFGPHHGKAHRIAAEFLRLGAGIEIAAGDGLLDAMRKTLTDDATRTRLAAAGDQLMTLHRGAARRAAERIEGLLA